MLGRDFRQWDKHRPRARPYFANRQQTATAAGRYRAGKERKTAMRRKMLWALPVAVVASLAAPQLALADTLEAAQNGTLGETVAVAGGARR